MTGREGPVFALTTAVAWSAGHKGPLCSQWHLSWVSGLADSTSSMAFTFCLSLMSSSKFSHEPSFVILRAILSPSQLHDSGDPEGRWGATWREQDLRECLAPGDPRHLAILVLCL